MLTRRPQVRPLGIGGDEFDRFFNGLLARPLFTLQSEENEAFDWAPPIDLSETETHVLVRAEAPGVDPKDLDITISENVLSIAGEKEETVSEEKENYHRSERRFGAFVRRVTLPCEVNAEDVHAQSKGGVLTIKLPKRAATKPKKIAVHSG